MPSPCASKANNCDIATIEANKHSNSVIDNFLLPWRSDVVPAKVNNSEDRTSDDTSGLTDHSAADAGNNITPIVAFRFDNGWCWLNISKAP